MVKGIVLNGFVTSQRVLMSFQVFVESFVAELSAIGVFYPRDPFLFFLCQF